MQKLILIVILVFAAFLRFYQLQSVPPGFYADEASWAYNAYSILLTGRDEYGRFLPWNFEAFGDYKLGVTVYSILPSYLLFGVSEWSARLPTAIYGILAVLGIYLLCRELQKHDPHLAHHQYFPLFSAGILAITPGHIFMSRGIWDVQAALCYTLFGTIFFLKAIDGLSSSFITRTSLTYFTFSAISFALSIYSYNSSRVITPLLLLFLLVSYFRHLFPSSSPKQAFRNLFALSLPFAVGLTIMLPQLLVLTTPQVLQRAQYVSIFQHGEVDAKLYAAIQSDPPDQPVLLTRLLHNKPIFYSTEFFQNYLSHFELDFLFLTGDTFEIFQVQSSGILLLIFLPFLAFGLYASLRYHPNFRNLAWFLLLVSPVPSALTIFTPSVSRAQLLVIPFTIFTAYGLLVFLQFFTSSRNKAFTRVFLISLVLSLSYNHVYWFHQYFAQTPPKVAVKWNDGWHELARTLEPDVDKGTPILVSNSQAPSYIFLAWYLRIPPSTLWQTRVTDFRPDTNGLNTTTQILNNIYFSKQIKSTCSELETAAICVGFFGELEGGQSISNSYSQPVFQVLHTF